MKRFGFALIAVLVGALNVPLSEASMMALMGIAPWEATSNFFWGAIVPTEMFTVGLCTLILMKVHKANPALHLPLYAVTYLVLHLALLHVFLNPLNDLVAYAGGTAIAFAVWFSLLWRFYLRDRQS